MFTVNPRSITPLYEQLEQNIISMIASGILSADDQLPSVRSLARDLGLNPNTVQKAYSHLEDKGIIYQATGRGSFVASVETAMEKVLEELEWGVETTYGANAAEITEAIKNSTGWLFDETPFRMILSNGDWSYDSEGNIIRELWECTITITNTETGESASASNVLIPLTFDPESAW